MVIESSLLVPVSEPVSVPVADGGTGRSFRARDPDDLARALGGLLADPASADPLIAAGLRLAEEHRWERIAEQLEAHYASLGR